MKTLIVAEAGVNHNGDMVLAKRMIDVAAESGADFIKFQSFRANRQVTTDAKKADYQLETTSHTESQYEMLRKLEMSDEMHHELLAYCKNVDINFLSTAFDIEGVDFLNALGLQYFKIPSGEITNLPYLERIGRLRREVFLSTGMSSLGEIESAIEILENAGTPRSNVTVMHCTSEYPTPMSEVNLRAMQTIQSAFKVSVGYSDHTNGIEVATAAVALGARVIEKHFTIDRGLPGPDHKASIEPDELKALILAVRNIEEAMGDGIKRLMPSEAKNKDVIRKSLVASREIRAGEVFSQHNVTSKRPAGGISPMLWRDVQGKFASRDFAVDEFITL